jgi:uncharacterized protein (DUF362 family)
MDRRTFIQIAAAPIQIAAAPALVLAANDMPVYRVVSRYPPAPPLGMPGVYRGMVTRVHSNAVIDEKTERVDSAVVNRMLSEGMRSLTSAKTDKDAWAIFFSPSDVVGIKVNCSGAPGISSTPELVAGIVDKLIKVGVKEDQIYIYERFVDQLLSVHYERYVLARVHIVAVENPRSSLLGYDPRTFVEVNFFGEEDTRSNLVRLVSERFTKIINVPNVKEHQAAGVTGCLKNIAYGNFSNVARSHAREKTNTLSFIGTLAAVEPLRSKTVLNIMDGIRGVWHGGPFSRDQKYRFYPKVIMFGTDPVAMDRILLDIIAAKREAEGALSLWDRSPANIDRGRQDDFHKNTFIREPGHIEYATKFGLGEYDKKQIRVTPIEV